jgi:hypothetical protein
VASRVAAASMGLAVPAVVIAAIGLRRLSRFAIA